MEQNNAAGVVAHNSQGQDYKGLQGYFNSYYSQIDKVVDYGELFLFELKTVMSTIEENFYSLKTCYLDIEKFMSKEFGLLKKLGWEFCSMNEKGARNSPFMINKTAGFVLFVKHVRIKNGYTLYCQNEEHSKAGFVSIITGKKYKYRYINQSIEETHQDVGAGWIPIKLIADIYEIPIDENVRDETISNKVGLDVISNNKLIGLLKFSGNMFESILRESVKCKWLFGLMMDSVRDGKCINVKDLRSLFNVDSVGLKKVLAYQNEELLMFYLLSNNYRSTTLSEATKAYQIIKDTPFLNKDKFGPDGYLTHKPLNIRGANRRIILSSCALPAFLNCYEDNMIYRNCSINKYVVYLKGELKKDPNITIKQISILIKDFNKMSREILGKRDIFRLPYNCRKAHDTMMINYNEMIEIKNAGREKDAVKALMKVYKDEAIYIDDDVFVMTRPYYLKDFHYEGVTLNHCVATYSSKVLRGGSKIFFMRKKSNPNKPLLTIELIKGRIVQIMGMGRRGPTRYEIEFANKWLQQYTTNLKLIEQKKFVGCKEATIKRKEISELMIKNDNARDIKIKSLRSDSLTKLESLDLFQI